MNADTVNAIASVIGEPKLFALAEGGERLMLPPGWRDATPDRPTPDSIDMWSLDGLRDYIAAQLDAYLTARVFLQVRGPDVVVLQSGLAAENRDFVRHTYATVATPSASYRFGEWDGVEHTIIALQSQFVDTPERNNLINLLGSIRDGAVEDTLDDGLSQQVKTQRGVALLDRTRVPSPVLLAPYRTFREVAQPVSPFVVRLRSAEGRPMVGLYEADGGTWRLEAIKSVGAYLRLALKDQPQVVVLA